MADRSENPKTEDAALPRVVDRGQTAVANEQRIATFARFFKNYMSVSSVVTAALPIPITQFRVIPTYSAMTSLLSAYTSLFCFLLLGFIFYSRHRLARSMFSEVLKGDKWDEVSELVVQYGITFKVSILGILPLILIGLSLYSGIYYLRDLSESVSVMKKLEAIHSTPAPIPIPSPHGAAPITTLPAKTPPPLTELAPLNPIAPSFESILKTTEFDTIPAASSLFLSYVGFFLFAEAAFILMAIREYLEDLTGLSEMELISGTRRAAKPTSGSVG